MIICLALALQPKSFDEPRCSRTGRSCSTIFKASLHLLCLSSSGVYLSSGLTNSQTKVVVLRVTSQAVVSYTTVSPLSSTKLGCLVSVALSLKRGFTQLYPVLRDTVPSEVRTFLSIRRKRIKRSSVKKSHSKNEVIVTWKYKFFML